MCGLDLPIILEQYLLLMGLVLYYILVISFSGGRNVTENT